MSTPIPNVNFQQGPMHKGDLIGISKLDNYPLSSSDNWVVQWNKKPISVEKILPNEHESAFGSPKNITTTNALVDKSVWVVGDSFSKGLEPYLNATFKDVRYIGHWSEKLDKLSDELAKANKKPDIIIIERVERSF